MFTVLVFGPIQQHACGIFFNKKMWDVKIKLNSPYCCFKNVSLFRKKGKWAGEPDTMLQQHYMQ